MNHRLLIGAAVVAFVAISLTRQPDPYARGRRARAELRKIRGER
jgi:multisubunit Na+/H+ antiporter MnhG subunit